MLPILICVEITIKGTKITKGIQTILKATSSSEVEYSDNKIRFQTRFDNFDLIQAKAALEQYLQMQKDKEVITGFEIFEPGAKTTHIHAQRSFNERKEDTNNT